MPKRLRRIHKLNREEADYVRAARVEFRARPSKALLLASGQYSGPMILESFALAQKHSTIA